MQRCNGGCQPTLAEVQCVRLCICVHRCVHVCSLCALVCSLCALMCACVFAVCTCVFFSLWRVLCRSVRALPCIVSAHPLSSSSLIAEERVHASLVAWCKSANRKSKCQVLESKCQVIKSKCQVPRSCPTRFLRSGEVIYISISREQRNVA